MCVYPNQIWPFQLDSRCCAVPWASAHLFRSASDKSQGPQLRNLHRDFDTLYNASEVLNGAETC